MKINIDDDIILPAIAIIIAIAIVLCQNFCILQSTYDKEANVLAAKIDKLYKKNDKLISQNQMLMNNDLQELQSLRLQIKLIEDGASPEEAKLIVKRSEEVGLDPKS